MALGGGDQLARGAVKAQFEAGGSNVSQDKWNEAFGTEETEIERLRRKRVSLSDEESAQVEAEVKQEAAKIEEVRKAARTVPTSVPFRAVQDRVVVFRIEEEEVDKEMDGPPLIETPDEAKEQPAEGIVVAVGPGKFTNAGVFIPTSTKVGDRVLFGKFSGQETKVGPVVFLILREEDIFLIRQPIVAEVNGEN